jgi:hypothetical protein
MGTARLNMKVAIERRSVSGNVKPTWVGVMDWVAERVLVHSPSV